MFSFDKDQVKVQTEYGFCDAHAAVKVTIDDQALSMIGEDAPVIQIHNSRRFTFDLWDERFTFTGLAGAVKRQAHVFRVVPFQHERRTRQ